ncbi:MAG: hypothetical protein WC782_00110 [Methylococcaceae bacterium]|jgi:hypothetical protein
MDEKELWIGLADVIPMPNNQTLPANKGACVTVLLGASSATDFCDGIKAELLLYDYYVIGIEEVEKFSARKTKYILSDRLLAVAHETNVAGK